MRFLLLKRLQCYKSNGVLGEKSGDYEKKEACFLANLFLKSS